MGLAEIVNLAPGRALYPARLLAVTRERGFYVILNLLTGARRFYADPRDVEAAVARPRRGRMGQK